MNEYYDNGMRPKMGQTDIVLPITFDYSGGRADKLKSARLWAIIIEVLTIFFALLFVFGSKKNIIFNIVIGIVIIYVGTFINRFFLLGEGKYRREFIELDESKGKEDLKEIWGIYNISHNYPYICRFRNGKSGVVIMLNKDVVLGKYSEAEYEHYEAIADAYNIAGGSKIQMCHVDYMANIGMDERLDESFISLRNIDNEDVKDLLTDVYSFQKEQMQERVTTYDVYVFMWRGSDVSAWSTIQSILSCFMEANFRSYQVLNEDALRELPKTIFNLNEFSAVDAMLNAFDENTSANINPISIKKANGEVEVLGKTSKQRKEEMELAEKKIEIKKQEKKKAKKVSQEVNENDNIDWDEEFDLDE